MIKSLQRKFILITVISVAAVFLLIVGAINIVNYNNVYRKADARLDVLVENNGTFPMENMWNSTEPNSSEAPGGFIGINITDGQNPGAELYNNEGKEKKEFQKGERNANQSIFEMYGTNLDEESPFDTRYFNVTLTTDGEYVCSDLNNVAAVTEEDAIEYAKDRYSSQSESGVYNDYMYRQVEMDDGIMYVFVDCRRDFSSFRSFLFISLIISVLGLALVYLLVFLLSKIVLKPVYESYNKQKRFITDASHELKTPLAIINADVEVIELENGESDWTKSITKQTNRLSSLTEKMVMLTRMDEGAQNIDMINVDASKIFLEVAESFEPVSMKLGKELNINIEENIHMIGEDKSLTQMLSLLIDNAMKYSNENGRVDVTFTRIGKSKELKVRNTVDYIEEGRHDELFERFYRRDESRNSKTGGSGIGLSVVKAIAEMHKAKISAKSSDGKSLEIKVVF